MLDEFQRRRVWQAYVSACARALYFADLASGLARRLRWASAANFFLMSGAAAAIVAGHPALAETLAIISAALTATSIATSPEKRVGTLAELHSKWLEVSSEYERLWSHLGDPDAEEKLRQIVDRQAPLSRLAVADAPYEPKRLKKWSEKVLQALPDPGLTKGAAHGEEPRGPADQSMS